MVSLILKNTLPACPASLQEYVLPEDWLSLHWCSAALEQPTSVAFRIWPNIDKNPALRRVASKRLNSPSIAPVWIRRSRNSQTVLASGTRSDSPRPRKRMKERRSLIRYSVRSSGKLLSVWIIRILNISTGSNGGRPPWLRADHQACSTGQAVLQHQRSQTASYRHSLNQCREMESHREIQNQWGFGPSICYVM